MRLVDAIADTTPPPPRPSKVDRLIAKIHPDDREAFTAMMLDNEYGHHQLTSWLSKMAGESISESTLGEWRRERGVRV